MMRQKPKEIPFRVGINEGIMVDRKKVESGEIELFTDGLAGCVAFVVVNDEFVFMSHVSKSFPGGVGAYLDTVVNRMGGGGKKKVQVGLAAAEEQDQATLDAFKAACDERGIETVPQGITDQCRAEITRKGVLSMEDGSYRPYFLDVRGTLTRPDLIKGRIDVNDSRFGEIGRGDEDYHNILFREIDEPWKNHPALRVAILNLAKIVEDPPYVLRMLQRIDDQAQDLTLDQRLKICHQLAEQFVQMHQTGKMVISEELITDIVESVLLRSPEEEEKERSQQSSLLPSAPISLSSSLSPAPTALRESLPIERKDERKKIASSPTISPVLPPPSTIPVSAAPVVSPIQQQQPPVSPQQLPQSTQHKQLRELKPQSVRGMVSETPPWLQQLTTPSLAEKKEAEKEKKAGRGGKKPSAPSSGFGTSSAIPPTVYPLLTEQLRSMHGRSEEIIKFLQENIPEVDKRIEVDYEAGQRFGEMLKIPKLAITLPEIKKMIGEIARELYKKEPPTGPTAWMPRTFDPLSGP